mmetsp:Transcript_9408/g.18862  ORF Transcript_9408/g.18862 Transcript_9408/m.18862 type:complete len:89 (-) Transcript_9408:128-394(-)
MVCERTTSTLKPARNMENPPMKPKRLMAMQRMVTASAKYREVSFALKDASDGFFGKDASTFSADVEKTITVDTRNDIDDMNLVGMMDS